jgi:molybdenum cofactor synthesis domain-containing protein
MAKRTARVITASNRASNGVYADTSGESLASGLTALGYALGPVVVVPDDIEKIQSAIKAALVNEIDLIVTTGGTGISPTDVTPQATADLIEKLLPGIPEALRAYSRANVPTSDLSRGLAGVTGKSLIINLPGSPGAVRDGLVIIERLAGHVHDQLAGQDHSPSN